MSAVGVVPDKCAVIDAWKIGAGVGLVNADPIAKGLGLVKATGTGGFEGRNGNGKRTGFLRKSLTSETKVTCYLHVTNSGANSGADAEGQAACLQEQSSGLQAMTLRQGTVMRVRSGHEVSTVQQSGPPLGTV